MFLARRSRSLQTFSASENRRWLSRIAAATLAKTQHLSEEVYQAMLARGYTGETRTLDALAIRQVDYPWIAFSVALTALMIWVTYR